MSDIKYGLISQTDARTLEKTIDLICYNFPGSVINTCEIGVFDGQSSRGIYEYVTYKQYGALAGTEGALMEAVNFKCNHTAIDNEKDKPILKPFPECNLIIGNSNEVYNQLKDESQHLIVQDACHCFSCVVSSFYCYADKVKVGGYMAFHDTGKHIAKFKDFQHGDKDNPKAYISVREALLKIGLLRSTIFIDMESLRNVDLGNGDKIVWEEILRIYNQTGIRVTNNIEEKTYFNWVLVYDIADPENLAGGFSVFKKIA